MAEKEKLLEFLYGFLTPGRKEAFDRVLAYRTRHFTFAIEDLHKEKNSSAIMRTCESFGLQDIHVIEGKNYLRPSPLISGGASGWLDIHHYHGEGDNSLACITKLKDKGYQIVATLPGMESVSLADFDISPKSAFFMGDELDGLSQTAIDHADVHLRVPMWGFTQSFNVSVTAGIILQQVVPSLHQSDEIDWRLSPEEILDIKIKWSTSTIKKGEELVRYFMNG
jgi:tRNA (guanosine-2'-O-)-methyltransferase